MVIVETCQKHSLFVTAATTDKGGIFAWKKGSGLAVACLSNALAFGPHVCLLLMFSQGENLFASVLGITVQALGISLGTVVAGTEAHVALKSLSLLPGSTEAYVALRSLSLLLGSASYIALAFSGEISSRAMDVGALNVTAALLSVYRN